MSDAHAQAAAGSGNPTESLTPIPHAPATQLKPGDLLAGRFQIIRFLARGGMGEVYEASDQHLQGKHVALKTMRPAMSGDATVKARFEREVLLAREVVHPNVCPTYDLFREETPAGPLLFLTMKLIRGESLSARLGRAGRFSPDAALPLVRQMADALDAAHQAGVIHRDFKPGNVMLESVGAESRVSITDFGLSRISNADSTLAPTGQLQGTLGYMAPELLQGQPASPATDLYAFGVVVYEMLTGQKPRNPPGKSNPVRTSEFVPDMPPAWDRVIEGCLAHDPARRLQSAREALMILQAGTSRGSVVALQGQASLRRALAAGGILTILVAAAAWLAWQRIGDWLHPLPKQRFVAVMAWPPASNSAPDPLLRGILDAIDNRLARAESTIPQFAAILPSDAAPHPPRTLSDVAGTLGANLLLAASLRSEETGYTLSLQLVDTGTGAVLRLRNLRILSSRLSALGHEASRAAAALLDITPQFATPGDSDNLLQLAPSVFRLFTEAEDLRTQPNNAGLDEAIEKYQKILEVNPHFGLAYADLSLAYSAKYQTLPDPAYLSLAENNAESALRDAPDSSRSVLAAAVVSLRSGKTQQALDGISHALHLDPGNPQILVYKAGVFRDLGRPREEEQVYRDIIRQRPNYWPAYNDLGSILYHETRYQEAADAFGQAAALAPRAALPLANQGAMYLLLKKTDTAEEAFRRSLARAPTEEAYENLGSILFQRSEYRKALESYQKGRNLNPQSYQTWRNIADCYAMLGDSRNEIEAYGKAADILSEALRINPRQGARWATLAFYQAKRGRRAEAEADLKTAESRGLDRRGRFTEAQTLAVLGRQQEALRLVLQCLDEGLSPVDVELALDLKSVRADPRYRRHLGQKSRD